MLENRSMGFLAPLLLNPVPPASVERGRDGSLALHALSLLWTCRTWGGSHALL